MPKFDPSILRPEDRNMLAMYVGDERVDTPDFTITPNGKPYLFRWHIVPRNKMANVYLHVQVASDDDRALHDHPWENQSVVLAGGYDEVIGDNLGNPLTIVRRAPGDVVCRDLKWSHRLIMPEWNTLGYTMSLFTTGPKVRDWGFWVRGVWTPWQEFTATRNGESRVK